MGWPLVKALLWSLLLFVQIHEHRACIEEERMGLLELKAFLKSHTNYTKPLLPTWVYETEVGCCSWERVNCSTTTGHVINLTLSKINNEQDFVRGTWFLNVSLLQPFKELRILDLSYNRIAGWLGNEESHCLSKMSKLTQLNLGHNNFDKEILRSLGALPVLKSLDLSFNNMWPLSDKDLRGNYYTGSITSYIGALSSLKAISLSENELNGTLNTPDLCALKKLEELSLAGNEFEGILPPCLNDLKTLWLLDISGNRFSGNLSTFPIANLTSLEYIDLSHNLFGGSLSSSPIAGLTSLWYIDLSYNRFDGIFSFNIFSNHSKLKVIQFLNDNNKPDIEIEDPSWGDPLFQLKVLVLSNCNLNKHTGSIPKFLYDQHELEVVDISQSKLNGSFPNWLLENNTGLQRLNLRSNSFTGQFYLPPNGDYKDLRWLDVSDNHIDGQLQENIGKMIPKLEHLNLSKNHFDGNFPSSIGIIPEWIGNLSMALSGTLVMSNNLFKGRVPCVMGQHIIIDFSHNVLSGSLPSCFNLQYVEHVLLQGNKLTGSLPKSIFNSSFLLTLDIRDNNFLNDIPGEIVGLPNLRELLLSGNHFTGMIPKQLCQLKRIHLIDLSNNSFSGSIPHCLHNITFEEIDADDLTYANNIFWPPYFGLPYESLLSKNFPIEDTDIECNEQVEINFVTKYRSNLYKGLILHMMSGLDFSFNKLTGVFLYINPYWQQRCFNFVENRMYWCHEFSVNMLKARSNCIRH
ncbi:receptor-like protein 56 [Quercus suber]|uniref:Receptor-like protein 56 n=1 Tax=Quercus suber TaxID=58331 RepID=A0AAW0ITI6_QUESU